MTIDDDVAAQLERLRPTGKGSLKQLVNDLLRAGLESKKTQPAKRRRQRTKSVNLGKCLIGRVDDVAEVLAVAEGEDFR